MPRKGRVTQPVNDWALASWEWAGDLYTATGCKLQVSMGPVARRGVWRVTVRALEVVDGRPAGIRCQQSGEWPNSESVDLLPYVFKLLCRLDAALAQEPLRQGDPS